LVIDGFVHVPSFDKNLVSGIQLMKLGYHQEVYKDRCFVRDQPNGRLVATVTFILPLVFSAWMLLFRRLLVCLLNPLPLHANSLGANYMQLLVILATACENARCGRYVGSRLDTYDLNSLVCEPCPMRKSKRHSLHVVETIVLIPILVLFDETTG
jgi:hypothetical protein